MSSFKYFLAVSVRRKEHKSVTKEAGERLKLFEIIKKFVPLREQIYDGEREEGFFCYDETSNMLWK